MTIERYAGLSRISVLKSAQLKRVRRFSSNFDPSGLVKIILDTNTQIRAQAINKILQHLEGAQYDDAQFTLNNYGCFSNAEKKQVEDLLKTLNPDNNRVDKFDAAPQPATKVVGPTSAQGDAQKPELVSQKQPEPERF